MNMPRRWRVTLILGTRPEAIKLAPVHRALAARAETFEPALWATGQHRQLLDQALRTFDLAPDRDFDLMRPGQTLEALAAAAIQALTPALAEARPEVVLVQGDTTTAMAGALAAFYARVPAIGHVEAGLRTGDKASPFPEEMNRRLLTRLADLHFAPTGRARAHLLAEGVPASQVWATGNTVIDAVLAVAERVRRRRPAMPPDWPEAGLANGRRLVLITGHRRENFGPPLAMICEAISRLARGHPDCAFVYPVHLNPQVLKPVRQRLAGLENVFLTEPLDYEGFVWAMTRSRLILSDSGGVQEEAPALGKPVLVTREKTEREEAIEAGSARLVGADVEGIVETAGRLLSDEAAYAAMSQARLPFGDGHAGERIADILALWLTAKSQRPGEQGGKGS